MPCCKAEEFRNWCEGEDLFDYEGEKYCVFHLPVKSLDKPHHDFYIPLLASKSPEGLGLGFKVLHKAYQLIITLQAGFFALAMRNRYRR